MLNNCKSGHLISDQTKKHPSTLVNFRDQKHFVSWGKHSFHITARADEHSTLVFLQLGVAGDQKQEHLVLTGCVVFLYFTVNSGCYSVRMDFRQPYKFSQLCLVPTNLLASARKFCTSITPHYSKEAASCVKNKCHL